MTNSIFDRFSSTDIASVQRKHRKQKQGRILRIEELENRELLSVSPWNAVIPMPSSMTQWDDSTDASTQVIVSSASASVMSAVDASSAQSLEKPIISVVDTTPTSITLSWEPVEGATSYSVEYYLSAFPFSSLVRISDITDTSVTLTGLHSGLSPLLSYVITVRAFSDDGSSSFSLISGYPAPIPAAPTLAVGAVTDSSVALDWTAVADATHYEVRYRVGNGGEWVELTTADTSLVVTDLNSHTTYEFQVRAGYDGELGSWNTFFSIVSVTTAPLAPTGLDSDNSTGLSTMLTWNVAEGAERYELQYRSGTDEWTSISSTAALRLVSFLTSGTTYEFRVRAVGVDGASEWSDMGYYTNDRTIDDSYAKLGRFSRSSGQYA